MPNTCPTPTKATTCRCATGAQASVSRSWCLAWARIGLATTATAPGTTTSRSGTTTIPGRRRAALRTSAHRTWASHRHGPVHRLKGVPHRDPIRETAHRARARRARTTGQTTGTGLAVAGDLVAAVSTVPAVVLFGERPLAQQWVGTGVVLLGLVVNQSGSWWALLRARRSSHSA